jgi:hypothetical protein
MSQNIKDHLSPPAGQYNTILIARTIDERNVLPYALKKTKGPYK